MKPFLSKQGVVFVLLMTIFVCADACAENWRVYFSTGTESSYYDLDSITLISKGVVRVWTQAIYTQTGIAEQVKAFGVEFESLHHSRGLWEISCAEKKMRLLGTVYYSRNGMVLFSSPYGCNWCGLPPGNIGMKLMQEICKF
jgi:hypothetical protein